MCDDTNSDWISTTDSAESCDFSCNNQQHYCVILYYWLVALAKDRVPTMKVTFHRGESTPPPSIYLSKYIYPSIHISVYIPIYLCIYLPIYLCIYLCIYLFIYLSMYLPIYLCIYLSIYVSIYLSIYLCIYLSIYLSMYLSIYLSMYLSDTVRVGTIMTCYLWWICSLTVILYRIRHLYQPLRHRCAQIILRR